MLQYDYKLCLDEKLTLQELIAEMIAEYTDASHDTEKENVQLFFNGRKKKYFFFNFRIYKSE